MSTAPKVQHRKNRVLLVILVHIAVICVVTISCLQYTKRVFTNSSLAEQSAFRSTVSSMEKMAYDYLKNHQEVCNNWAKYLNDHPMTLEEAADYLRSDNSNENVMAHLIDLETYTGLSTVPCADGSYEVDYSRTPLLGYDSITGRKQEGEAINISNMYANPINAISVVSFARMVKLVDEAGEELDYCLMRVVPVKLMQDHWTFPAVYQQAELSLIKKDGSYIVRSEALKNSSFWEYMRIYNELTYAETDELAVRLMEDGEVYQGRDAYGNEVYYDCLIAEKDNDWCFVGYVPVASIRTSSQDWTIVFYVGTGMLLIFVMDGLYILSINRRLKVSAEEARTANLAKTRFLSSMSHDIRTPMNAIVGMTTIASKYINDPEQVRDCLEKISLASNHLLTLINDVLDISKVESGRMTLTPMVFSLSESVTNLANIVRPNVQAKSLEFNIRTINIRHENLYADELRLNQIFINLLSNAVKYTPEGGRVTLELEEREIAGQPNMVELVYSVTDNGIGMSAEFQKVMYESFSRAVDTRIDKIQGTGLGLAITKQLVDLMGGTIACESELGKGTRFTLMLKVAVAEKMTDDLVLPPMELLLVDDDEVFLRCSRDTLESLHLVVETASSGKQAVDMVVKRHEAGRDYPMVIIDWKMPEMDGVETTRRIREAVGSEVPIIIISSYDWTEVEEAAREAGADAFINKPLFKSSIYYKLKELLNQKEDQNQPEEGHDELSGLRLLVAEDNDMNWEIIEELLGLSDISCDRAANGEICVDMFTRVAAGTYQAILMDIQMPVMNGYEACRAIRNLSSKAKREIPIIAMTADAFAEDIRACMDAGMNGHVAKPIDLDKLFEELKKVLGK